jgi:WD40 repeat protein
MSVSPHLPPSPYKGLVPYDDSELDARFFFGREREIELVAANLMAADLTVLYGPSGVGKSSLLRAGVARRLRAHAAVGGGDPGLDVVVVDVWSDDPVATIAERLGRPDARDGLLADVLAERTLVVGGELYLVLDQMEEYFLYHPAGGPLATELEEIILRPDLRVHVLLGIRDDAFAALDAFKSRVPGLFGNVVRLDHLDRDGARAAIIGPLEAYAQIGCAEVTAEPPLVESVIRQTAAGQIAQGITGRGSLLHEEASEHVEASFMQLVMERLWEVERSGGSTTLRAATLDELGGAARIVEQHLDLALASLATEDRDIASRLFNQLVTPSGMKIAHGVHDLARYAGTADGRLDTVLRNLAAQRIVRPLPDANGGGPRYEIFHDVLADGVLAWRARHETERALERERVEARRRHRRLAVVAGLALMALVLMTAVAMYALAQRGEARERARSAQSRELAATALTQIPLDPEQALALALEAARLEQSPRVDTVLRETLLASRVRGRAAVGTPVQALDAAPGGELVAATGDELVVLDRALRVRRRLPADGRFLGVAGGAAMALSGEGIDLRDLRDGRLLRRIPLRPGAALPVRDVDSGRVVSTLRLPEHVKLAALRPKGTLLALSDGTRRVVVLNTLTGEARYQLEQPSGVTSLDFGPNGRLLATGGKDGTARLWTVATGRQRSVLQGHRGYVLDLDFSPRATLLATASADGTGRMWRLGRAQPVSVLVGHTNPVRDVAFSPFGDSLVTASDDGTARVWRADTGGQLAELRGHDGAVTSAHFVQGGTRVVTGGDDRTLRLWDPISQPSLALLADLGRPVVRVSARNGAIVEAVTDDGRVHRIHGPGDVSDVDRATALAPVRSALGATAELDGEVARIRRSDGRHVTLRGHAGPVTSVRFSPDGRRAVTASRDRTARIWDAETGEPLSVLRGHFAIVSDASFSPDGRFVVTAGPGTAGLFEADAGRLLLYLSGHEDILLSAVFDPTGTRIVTGGRDGTVRVYDCEVCGSGRSLVAAAERRLAQTRRVLSVEERERLLGG